MFASIGSLLMHIYYDEQIPKPIVKHALIVMTICFLPNITHLPWWLSLIILAIISYRSLAIHYQYPVPPWWLRLILVLLLISVLRLHYGSFSSNEFFIATLLSFYWLKWIELQRLRDLRLLILISFYVIFTVLVLHANLWVFSYVIFAVFALITLLLKLERPGASIYQLVKQSIKGYLIAIPMSVVLFFLFPRISSPLWMVNMHSQGQTAFQEEMRPGYLSTITKNFETIMRIRFKKQPISTNLYWTGLALSEFDGMSWKEAKFSTNYFVPVKPLINKKKFDYEVLLEAHASPWLFYQQTPIQAWPKLRFSSLSGLQRLDGKPIYKRISYSIVSKSRPAKPLNRLIRAQNLKFPNKANPKLQNFAQTLVKKTNHQSDAFIRSIKQHIQTFPFWYSLNPVPMGRSITQLDRFFFQTREGYCEYYASAVAFILRAAHIPARVILGYYGGDWNPIGHYLQVRHKDAHAWVEYWHEQKGWVRIDPTSWIPLSRVDPTLLNNDAQELPIYDNWERYQTTLSWFKIIKLHYESTLFWTERWLLFYNQERQKRLLNSLHIKTDDFSGLLQIWIGCVLLFLGFGALYYHLQGKKSDPLSYEYQRLEKELMRFQVSQSPPATLFKQLDELIVHVPHLSLDIHYFLKEYKIERLWQKDSENAKSRQTAEKLIRALRKKIARTKITHSK